MALSKIVQSDTGLIAADAYIRVEAVLRLTKFTGFADVCYFANSKQTKPFDIKNFKFDYNLNGDNPIKQAYTYLKTLPEFTDATDC